MWLQNVGSNQVFLNKTRSMGFTLIELLVVISIVVLLIATLLPSLRSARESSIGVVCLTRHRQLIAGVNMYMEINDGMISSPKFNIKKANQSEFNGIPIRNSEEWFTWTSKPVVGQFVSNNSYADHHQTNPIVYCPSVSKPTLTYSGIGLTNYWSNCLTPSKLPGGVSAPIPMWNYASPAKFGMLYDAAYSGYQRGCYFWSELTRENEQGIPVNSSGTSRLTSSGTNFYIHLNRTNVSYADGHAASIPDVVDALKETKNLVLSANAQ
jgi:prepilin-type processing-associated H-X9-DG protein/prepilin-type N-terminal cleavage/methylation domain-containing protein